MATLINQTSETMYVTAQRGSEGSYETTIPAGGAWAIPADVDAVQVHDEN